jgi:hypothetical protein
VSDVVTVRIAEPFAVIVDGLMSTKMSPPGPLALKVTVPVKPFWGDATMP